MAASQSLLDRELLLATPSIDGPADGVLEEELEIEVTGVTDASGRSVLPAFSSEQSLLRWAADGSQSIALDGRTVLGLFIAGPQWDKLVVDGNSADAFEVTREEAERLLRTESA